MTAGKEPATDRSPVCPSGLGGRGRPNPVLRYVPVA